MQSPLLGFNNNVKHKGRIFHIQTEDSGIRHPHVITHLFADGGRILKTIKTSYSEHLGEENLEKTVRDLMKDQHKAMFIALRDGQFDHVFEEGPNSRAAPAVSRPAPAVSSPAPAVSAPPDPIPSALPVSAPPELPSPESASPRLAARARPGRAEAPDPFLAAPPGMAIDVATIEQAAMATKGEPPRDRPSSRPKKSDRPGRKSDAPRASERGSGRYAAARPAAVFARPPTPETSGSIFGGDDLISEKSLDEVILSYLSEDLELASSKK